MTLGVARAAAAAAAAAQEPVTMSGKLLIITVGLSGECVVDDVDDDGDNEICVV